MKELSRLQSELFYEDGKLKKAVFNRNKELIFQLTNFLDPLYETVQNQQRLWHIKKGIMSPTLCRVCGQHPAKWHNYHHYGCCSKECSKKSFLENNPMKRKEVVQRVADTNMKRYGVKTNFLLIDNPMQRKDVLESRRLNNQKKYGVDYYSQTDEFKERIKKTRKEKGLKSSFKDGINPTHLPDYHEKRIKYATEKAKHQYEELGYEYVRHIEGGIHLLKCKVCETEFSHSSNRNSRIEEKISLCPCCNPRIYSISQGESKMYNTLCKAFPTETIEQTNKTELINPETNYPLELDIYFPKYKLAIEYNGIRYHAHPDYYKAEDVIDGRKVEDIWERDKLKKELCKQKGIQLITVWENEWSMKTYQNVLIRRISSIIANSSHINVIEDIKATLSKELDDITINGNRILHDKTEIEVCNVLDHNVSVVGRDYYRKKSIDCSKHGIRYIQIWEDEYQANPHRYRQYLMSQLFKHKNVIYGRECTVTIIDNAVGYKFQDQYHLQGSTPATVTYGLFYNNELISTMSFKCTNKQSRTWEISRLCTKTETAIIGGTERMYKAFLKDHTESSLKFSTLITYSDASKFTGRIYERLGMVELSRTECGYSYVDKNGVRISRQQCKVQKLHRMYPQYANMTEAEIVTKLDYKKVENCGNYKFMTKF